MKLIHKIHLIILILLLSILVVFSSNLDFDHLLQNTPNISGIHPDTLQLYDPYQNYIWNVKELFDYDNLVKISPLFSFLLISFFTICIGLIIIEICNFNHSLLLKSNIFFGYFLGYLFNIAVLRILSLYIPLGYSNIIHLLICLILIIYFFKKIIKHLSVFDKFSDIGYLVIFLFFIIWQIQSGRNNFIADSNHFLISTYLIGIKESSIYEFILPIFGKQYDEQIYNLLFFNFIDKTEIVHIYWLNLSFFKFSLFWSLFYFFKQKNNSIFLPLIYSIIPFIIIQNFSVPFYKELWGGQNPLLWMGHQTRLSSIFIFLIIFLNYEMLNQKIDNTFNKFLLILIGLALSALSIHIAILSTIFFIVCKIKTNFNYKLIGTFVKNQNINLYLIYLSLFSLIITYSFMESLNGFYGIIIFFTGIIIFLFFKNYKIKNQNIIFNKNSSIFYIFIGLIIGLFFLGNQITQILYSNNITNALKTIFPAYYSLISNNFQTTQDIFVSKLIFYPNGCLSMAQHCKDLNNFFIHYAILIISIFSSCFVFVLRNNLNKNIYLSKNIHFLLIHIILLLISFFITDFIFSFGPGYSYVMTRFLDYSYYVILLILMMMSKDYKYLYYYFILLFLVSIFALIYNSQLKQFLLNANYLINNL